MRLPRPAACLASAACLLLLAADVQAGSPRLARVYPPGGQRGTTVEVDLVGRYMDQPREVLFYEPGITAESLEMAEFTVGPTGQQLPAEAGTRVRVRLKLAPDCPPGPHGLRLRTATGVSEYVRFFVGPFPTVEENEQPTKQRNDTRETATAVPANVTALGKLNDPTDVDVYRVEVKRGQRVSAEVEAARLGVDRGIPDLHLTLSDADGKTLAAADDSALFVQDPVLSVRAERDGAYFVTVRHSTYSGAGDVYRLHIGTFLRPTAVYPSGGPAGTDLKVRLLGDPLGEREQTARLPATPGDLPFVTADPVDGVPAPSPNRLRVSPFPNVLEVEPNDTPEASTGAVATLPVAFNGVIGKPNDVDCFRFRAKKGERFRFHALANALGSPLDPTFWVRPLNAKGNAGLQRGIDARPNQLGLPPAGGQNRDTHDPILEFTVPADGEYVLGVEDTRGGGGPEYVYRVEARPDEDAFHTYVAPEPENQQQPQARQTVAVAAGNRATVQVAVFGTGRPFAGEHELVGVGLPVGVTIHAPRLTPGMTKVPVVFEAAAGAPSAGALVELLVRPVGGAALPGGFRQTVMMNAYGNNDYYLHTTVHRLAVAVTEPAPFRVEVEEPKSALVQNGEMALPFKVVREDGFDGPVTVQMDWKPTGVSTAVPVTVPAGQTAGTYTLGAARNAAAGVHLLTLTATSGSGGKRKRGIYNAADVTYVASQPFKLTVAEPHVEAKIPRASVERGKTATVVCKLTHLQAYEGKAKATLARLPRGVELVEAVKEIAPGDKEVAFAVRATPEALVGNYQGIVLDLTVIDHGQPVRQLSGAGLLRVDAERGTPAKAK